MERTVTSLHFKQADVQHSMTVLNANVDIFWVFIGCCFCHLTCFNWYWIQVPSWFLPAQCYSWSFHACALSIQVFNIFVLQPVKCAFIISVVNIWDAAQHRHQTTVVTTLLFSFSSSALRVPVWDNHSRLCLFSCAFVFSPPEICSTNFQSWHFWTGRDHLSQRGLMAADVAEVESLSELAFVLNSLSEKYVTGYFYPETLCVYLDFLIRLSCTWHWQTGHYCFNTVIHNVLV